ncbi:Fur family transcriptional regulator [Rothia sp. ZJ932]|uniref:Fur family transcriptional regulator n=1 Tax=Rothia sp. ZJ932 TaxID=2810516 RepID=UPI0019679D16|nr:Fur family transcriptional regulator [Rothia sp. ZJ932]QRZ62017.1 transcriptional repressor [Rothia sp. ZJ932]
MPSLTATLSTTHNSPVTDEVRLGWTAGLRTQGRRVTKQRLAVLDAVHRSPHSTAEAIVDAVRQELPSITVQSVYVVLADLVDIEMLRKFQPPGTPALYETRTGDNHHHALCIKCLTVEDVECTVGHAPCLTPEQSHGMQLLSADVIYRGICANCQNQLATSQ